MLGVIVITSLLAAIAVTAWRFFNRVWVQPKKMEKILRKQGFKGNSYRVFFGDAMETARMYEESYSKPIGINDDISPRVMPFIYKTIRTYGEKSFMWIGTRPMVFIMDPELMKIIMNKHMSFQKPFKLSNPIFRRLIGGLIRFEGEKWSNNRKKLNPFFRLDKLKSWVGRMQKQSEEILDQWSKIIPNDGSPGVIDVYPYFPQYTASVASYVLFSTPFEGWVSTSFKIISELTLLANQAQPFSIPGEQYLPTKRYRRANAIEKRLNATFTHMIEQRLEERETGEMNGEPDFFDLLLDELDEIDIKDKRARANVIHDIIQQCKLFYIAGHETTANLAAWTTVLLAFHQDWQARVREEIFQVIGNKAEITADDIAQLKLLNMVIHESLRLYPPAIEVSRVVEEEIPLGGDLCLPKGVMVMCPIILLHRSCKIWGDDVLEFKPERFADGALKAANGQAAFMPFGWGVRTCIGYNLGQLEAKMFFVMFMRRFSFELSPDYAHGPLVSLNLLMQYGAPLLLRQL